MSINPREIPTGAVRYNTDSNKMEVWIGDKWMQVAVSSPTLDGGTFVVGTDGQGYQGAAIQAYGAGAGLVVMQILNSAFTGEETDCGQQGGGRSAIYLENSYSVHMRQYKYPP